MESFGYDFKMENCANFITLALEKFVIKPVFSIALVFIGSDGNVGDSLGPLCGELIDVKSAKVLTYGSLKSPITAKEVPFLANFIKKAHPDTLVIVVDAAVGKIEDLGVIKVQNEGIKPGLGVDKDLPKMGDISVIGVLGQKTGEKNCFKTLRLSVVYKMAQVIACGLQNFIENNDKRLENRVEYVNRNKFA